MARNQSIAFVPLWDVDGVLGASEGPHREKHRYILKKYGFPDLADAIDEAHRTPQKYLRPEGFVTRSLHGTSDGDVYYWATTRHPELKEKLSLADWTEEELCHFENMAASGAMKERDGASQILQQLSDLSCSGFTVVQVVVTGGSERQMNANLGVVTRKDLIDFHINAGTVCAGTGITGKSYVSGIYEAKRLLVQCGFDIKSGLIIAFAIEDSPSGVCRIQADTKGRQQLLGGDFFYGIQWILKGEEPYRPDHYMPNLYYADSSPEALLQCLGGIQKKALRHG